MGEPVYLIAAVLAVTGLGVSTLHAWPDREQLALLGTAVCYGFLLEQGAIVVFERYSYALDAFPLVLLDVPLTIAIAWAAIIYATFQTAWAFGLSGTSFAAFSALYVLHVDLAIDAVAIRIPFWTWENSGVWFGVPINNFVGWYLIGLLFAGSVLVYRDRTDNLPLRMFATLTTAVGALILLLQVWLAAVASYGVLARAVGLTAMVAGAFVVVLRADIDPKPISILVAAIPIVVHLFYLGVLLWFGFHVTEPLLLAVAIAMLAVGLAVHSLPHLSERDGSASSPS